MDRITTGAVILSYVLALASFGVGLTSAYYAFKDSGENFYGYGFVALFWIGTACMFVQIAESDESTE